jgi:hypothetical protein
MSLDIERKVPSILRESFEKMLLDTTEPLDPLMALRITNLALNAIEVAYQMGCQDARIGGLAEMPY